MTLTYSFGLAGSERRNRCGIYRRKYDLVPSSVPVWLAIFAQTRQIFREGVFSSAARNSPAPAATSYSIQFGSSRVESIRRVVWLNSFRDKRTRNRDERRTLRITEERETAASQWMSPPSIILIGGDRHRASSTRVVSMSNRDFSDSRFPRTYSALA